MESLLWLQESYINKTDEVRYGGSAVYESWTSNIGDLYKSLVRILGRCTGKVYIDCWGRSRPIGWVFEKKGHYDDSGDTYLQECWVTLHVGPKTKAGDYSYFFLK